MGRILFFFLLLIILGAAIIWWFVLPKMQKPADKIDSASMQAEINRDYQDKLMEKLVLAKPGDVITIPAGNYAFDRSLSLNVDRVTLRGAGMDETILTFKGQKSGAEGLLVTASNFLIQDLTIEDTIGDALKISNGENITIQRVRTRWTRGPSRKNGAYGIYPVLTKNILVEESVAIGASDAGLYIGQSENVILRNNLAEQNVAGIEIENTVGADVYDNVAVNNTGGILVFNMPNLPQKGHSTRVYGNKVIANNTRNFGHKGTPVASIPAGTGILINSNDRVEIFDNEIKDNKTANIIISSALSTDFVGEDAQAEFDPYPEDIFIYSNDLSGGGNAPEGLDLKALKISMFGMTGSLPDILWDGYMRGDVRAAPPDPNLANICVAGEVELLNADGPNGYKNPELVGALHRCEMEKLKPISLRSWIPAGSETTP